MAGSEAAWCLRRSVAGAVTAVSELGQADSDAGHGAEDLPAVILDLCVTSPGSGPSPGKSRWPGDIRVGELAGSGSAAAGVAFLLPPLQGLGADPGVPGQ